jgi:hypothetical protein
MMFFDGNLGMNRRHFMRHMAGFSLMAAPSVSFVQQLAAAEPQMKKDHKSLIILWMSGGPSHMDTWDMKPGQPTGGEFKPIKTAASGVEICEHLPTVATQMKHLAIIRSLVSNEASHERGRTLMHTAYAPNPAVSFPSIGAVASQQLTPKDLVLPGFMSVSRPSEGPGFLGMMYAPFTVQNPGAPPQNLTPPYEIGQSVERMARRRSFLEMAETNFARSGRGGAPKAHQETTTKALDLSFPKDARGMQLKSVFDLNIDTDGKPMSKKLRQDYGENAFGNGCLLARKLVEAGVTCVEVDLGGWDNHNGIFAALHNNRGMNGGGLVDRLDRGMGTLVKDLADRGLLKNTVVLWMGEFGRTPKINQNAGRDHWARCWSVVVGGGGIKGGQVYGSTDKDGTSVKDDPCTVGDLFATVYQAIGVSPDTEIRDPLGRPRKISGEKGGKVLEKLL